MDNCVLEPPKKEKGRAVRSERCGAAIHEHEWNGHHQEEEEEKRTRQSDGHQKKTFIMMKTQLYYCKGIWRQTIHMGQKNASIPSHVLI